ncbi:zinc-dependent alcohol dehydrogenase family protein [Ferrimonas senticii]|uniref:zinc-dependent alcohol dehydrogenase family protein n=1 Tax=Ferrimonas senticii TaxID=394566 RepID=UPI0004134D2B|nr:zinc-dependent alcohol dehydrogenase family protein [Ferrimonas senticii]
MKASVIREFGGVEKFELAEMPQPEVKAGHVLVKVAASSVNTVDMMLREMGTALPFAPQLPAILGMDFAGTISAVGDGVTDFAVGDEVYGCAGGLADLQGSLAEYMLADTKLIARKPASLSMREAAALPLVAITAYEGLQRAGISAGQKVLVHGGAGGVGHVAVQLARYFGAEVFATISNDSGAELMAKLGATAINYKQQTVADYVAAHTDGVGFDLTYDSVGGENMHNSIEATKLNGQIASTVSLLEMDLSMLHLKGQSLHIVFMLIPMIHNIGRAAHGEILAKIADIVDQGALTPVLDAEQFSLADAGAAHSRLASGQAIGKVVIDVA